ncbi:hypothetical protein RQP46_000005 [Phenoliferia psychrophenolica]
MPPTLLALPTEIKVAIVQMVGWQEDALLLRKGCTRPESRAAARQVLAGGLGAVALVCKEFNQIAAQFLFQSVSAARMTPIFLHRISHRHSHLITAVEITAIWHGPAQVDKYDRALHILPSYLNLRALTLDATAACVLFGKEWINSGKVQESDSIQSLRWETLGEVARRVDELELIDFTPTRAARVLRLWTGLRRLRLLGLQSELPEDYTELGPIATEISRFQELHQLEITGAQDPDDLPRWPDAALATPPLPPPPLTSLKIEFARFHFTHFAFISSFHSTLKHLSLTTESVEPEIPNDPISETFRVHLPFLVILHVTNPSLGTNMEASTRLLLPFLDSPIADLSISDNDASFYADGRILTGLKGKLPTLRLLTLDSPMSCIPMSEFRDIGAFCADR